MAHLQAGKLNLALLRDKQRRELLEILDKMEGSKMLIWDGSLTGPVGLVAEYVLLKDHGVEKMIPLMPVKLPSTNIKNYVFICRNNLDLMDIVANNITNENKSDLHTKEYHLVFVPNNSYLCRKRLEELGVFGSLTIHVYSLFGIVPVDTDLLCMECPSSFRECALEGDISVLYTASNAIINLQMIYGKIEKIYGKGVSAEKVAKMVINMGKEAISPVENMVVQPQISGLILIDRTIDLLTPLFTQLTYEGLIDETFGISHTTATFPSEKFLSKQEREKPDPPDTKQYILNENDEMYTEIRHKNYHAIGGVLSKKAKALSSQYEERLVAKTVGEMKQFVSKLPHIQAAKTSLTKHTSITELLKEKVETDSFMECLRCEQEFLNGIDVDRGSDYVNECIYRKEPLSKVLRLIAIQSYCSNGLRTKLLEHYKTEIVHAYGLEYLNSLRNIEKCNLIEPQTSGKSFTYLRKYLKLVQEDVSELNPTDISYVYSGYAPLTVRFIQLVAESGFTNIENILDLLPGPSVQLVQPLPRGVIPKKNTFLVFYLGGVTYGEIAALDFLSSVDGSTVDYIVATTGFINGTTFIKQLLRN